MLMPDPEDALPGVGFEGRVGEMSLRLGAQPFEQTGEQPPELRQDGDVLDIEGVSLLIRKGGGLEAIAEQVANQAAVLEQRRSSD